MLTAILRAGAVTALFELSSFSLFAQAAEPVDSARAIQRLFARRRTGSTSLAWPAGFFLGYGAVAAAQGGDDALISLGLGAGLSAIGLAKDVRFSKEREEQILSAYRQGKPVPKNIRRRLRQKHFKV